MSPSERALAVRAIDEMAELAGLADAPDAESIVDREAHLVDPSNTGGGSRAAPQTSRRAPNRVERVYVLYAEALVGPRP